jgi:hypothetical protein
MDIKRPINLVEPAAEKSGYWQLYGKVSDDFLVENLQIAFADLRAKPFSTSKIKLVSHRREKEQCRKT